MSKRIALCATLAVVVLAVLFALKTRERIVQPNRKALPGAIPSAHAAEGQSSTDEAGGKGKGLAAIDRAEEQGKYLFVLFFRDDAEQTVKMKAVFDAAMKKVVSRAEGITINITDSSEKGIVERFGVDRAPMPLVLAVAPNGVITGGFPIQFSEEQLVDAMVGPMLQKCLKALREQKLVFVCVQGKATKSNDAAMKGVQDFKADSRFSLATEIVSLDPADPAEAKLLQQLQIDPKTDEAITIFLAPPGTAIGKFTGATNKDTLVAALSNAMSACGAGGCGPSGCGPRR